MVLPNFDQEVVTEIGGYLQSQVIISLIVIGQYTIHGAYFNINTSISPVSSRWLFLLSGQSKSGTERNADLASAIVAVWVWVNLNLKACTVSCIFVIAPVLTSIALSITATTITSSSIVTIPARARITGVSTSATAGT